MNRRDVRPGRLPGRIFVLGLVVLGAIGSPGAAIAQRPPVPLWHARADTTAHVRTRNVRRSQVIVFRNASTLLSDLQTPSFTLDLPGHAPIVATRDRFERPAPDILTWIGRAQGDTLSSVIFAVVRGTVVGSIHLSDGRIFEVGVDSLGGPLVHDVDGEGVPDEGDPVPATPDSSGTPCPSDDPNRIDVLVAYTPEARGAAGGQSAIEGVIYCAAAQANKSYLDSGIDLRIDLVYVGEVPFTEVGSVSTTLDVLADGLDLEDVRTLRDQSGADAALLIVERDIDDPDNEICGLSKQLPTGDPDYAERAYGVVRRMCAANAYSFTHELGHLLSANHDWDDDRASTFATDSYNHGYWKADLSTSPPSAWRTVMASRDGCESNGIEKEDCKRMLRWSDPTATLEDGSALGMAGGSRQANNVTTLREAIPTVAHFRCPPSTRQDVWMKDAWTDTGAEPDPALAGQPMWKSPYIWVRNERDPDHLHPHHHDNPIAGQSNWIYVKLHNGQAGVTGHLEVYVARASTGLAWPADWTLVQSIPLTSLAVGTSIVEAAWTPNVTGHYCLLARWVSPADPMTVAEGPDIEANVRGNNNLVWRNVNIIGSMRAMSTSSAQFLIANDTNQSQAFDIALVPSRALPDSGFLGVGRIGLRRVTPRVPPRPPFPRPAGVEGFVSRGDTLQLVDPRGGVIRGLRLGPRQRLPMELVITLDRPGARSVGYEFDVIQRTSRPAPKRTVGGVSYILRSTVP